MIRPAPMQFATAFFCYTALVKLADALTVLGVWYAVWYLRFTAEIIPVTKGLPAYSDYARVSLPLVLVFSIVFHIVGAYRRDRIRFGFRAFKKITHGAIIGTLVFIAICYFLRELNYSRVFLMLLPAVVIVALTIERVILELGWLAAQKYLVRPMRQLIVGTGELLEMYLHQLDEREPYPIAWVGRLGNRQETGRLSEVAYLGDEDRLSQTFDNYEIDRVIVSYPTNQSTRYEPILQKLAHELVEVKVLPDFGKFSTFTYLSDQECGIPLLLFNQAPMGATDRALKRVEDFFGSIILMILFSPIYLTIAILIKLTSKGPVFYKQQRMGADGTLFDCYKFRSMRVDAEKTTGAVWAKEEDDRTTPIGKWLRRTSLDEIPQFYNVLRGEMSLVGPRPERPVFVQQFKKEIPKYMLRHKMKSGVTGWAQINGWRGNTSLEERIKHDLYYIGHWSHLFDLKILCLTLWKGFVHRNAY